MSDEKTGAGDEPGGDAEGAIVRIARNGSSQTAEIVNVGKGEVPLANKDALGAIVQTKWLKVAATGQWAAAVIIGAALLFVSTKPAEFYTMSVLLAISGGYLIGRATTNYRVLDEIRSRERVDRELERMADVKKDQESQLLKARISSKVEETKRKVLEEAKPKKKGKGGGR